MLLISVKKGKAPDTPWEAVDVTALQHLAATEGFFQLQVIASVADKAPAEPDENGELPEFGSWTNVDKRQIKLSLLFPQDRKTLAGILIYLWYSCLEPKVPGIKDGLVELCRVAAEQGWVTLTDVIKQTHKANKGGRRKGTRNKRNIPLINYAKELKASSPQISSEALLGAVAAKTVTPSKNGGWRLIPLNTRGWSDADKSEHRIKIKKILQSEGLYPKTQRKNARKST
jgi:hypothetical protein